MNEVIIAAIAAGVGAVLAALGKMVVDIVKAKNEPKIKEIELGEKFETQLVGLKNSLTQSFEELKESVQDLSDRVDNFHKEQKEINIVSIRHEIVDTYETYKGSKKIPLPVYQSILDLYDKYKSLGGNSFIHEIIEEMKEWDKE